MSGKKDERLGIEELTGYTLEELRAAASDDDDIVFDDDNPMLTAEDWKHMRPASELPPEILAAFPKTKLRGPQKSPTKIAVSLRLSRDVVEHFKADGAGWQTRIDDALRKIVRKAS
jgi:uncharacterized protein (DUF4415 family)